MTDFDLTIIKTTIEHQKDNIEDVVVINKGMSNGDVILALFPHDYYDWDIEFSTDWWNASYQKGNK